MSAAVSQPPLLRQHTDVTAEWLSDVLTQAGQLSQGASVRSFETAPIGTGFDESWLPRRSA